MAERNDLYERLEPSVKAKIEASKDDYPRIYNNTKEALESTEYVIELPFGIICDLCNYFGVEFKSSSIFNLFNKL